MAKIFNPKTLIIFFAGFGILIVSIMFLIFPENQKPASAQTSPELRLFCQEPIPVGEMIEQSIDIMNDVYHEYIKTRNFLDSAIEQLQVEIADLYREQDPENLGPCDFSVCQPYVVDRAADFNLYLEIPGLSWLGVEPKKVAGVHFPVCAPFMCTGEPCADLSIYLNEIKSIKNAINNSREIVHNIFNKPSLPVTEEIRIKQGLDAERPGALITRPESVIRKIYLVREWLHPSPQESKTSCAMTNLEREKALAGEIASRFPMKCAEALSEGFYWPRPWSEYCEEECKEGATNECKSCLRRDNWGHNPPPPGSSFLAEINYKIYWECKGKCEDKLTSECIQCLKTKPAEDGYVGQLEFLSEEEFTALLCGGSYYNWTCCSETPLRGAAALGEICSVSELLTRAELYKYPTDYTPGRSENLRILLDCIEDKVKDKTTNLTPGGYSMPAEGESNDFYGSVFTFDHDYYACNYTRGNPVCSINCSHSINSCHYGGATGAGAMAVDFGTDFINHRETIFRAASQCMMEQGYSEEVAVSKTLFEETHLHISAPQCNITGQAQE